MAMMLGGRGGPTSEMNVTSLIDVLLVLLIIFMVLPHPSLGERAVIPQPGTDQTLSPPDKIIVIQLKQAGENQRPTLKINEEAVGWDDLGGRLQVVYSLRVDKVAFLKGDPEIAFQYVADVMDVIHHAGVTHVGLMGK